MTTTTIKGRRDRARARAASLRCQLRAQRAGQTPRAPVVPAAVRRASELVQAATRSYAAALHAGDRDRISLRRAELECARLALAIERQDPAPVRLAA